MKFMLRAVTSFDPHTARTCQLLSVVKLLFTGMFFFYHFINTFNCCSLSSALSCFKVLFSIQTQCNKSNKPVVTGLTFLPSALPAKIFFPIWGKKNTAHVLFCTVQNTTINNKIISVCVCDGFAQALEKAKEAGRKERALVRQREQSGNGDHINLDLTYSVSVSASVNITMYVTV